MKEFTQKHKKGLLVTLGIIGVLILFFVVGFFLLFFGGFNAMRDVAQKVSPGTSEISSSYDRSVGGSHSADVVREDSIMPPYPGDDGGADTDFLQTENDMLVKTGDLSLVVRNIDESIAEIRSIVNSYESGFIGSVDVSQYRENMKRGNLEVRVPSSNFEDAFAQIKDLAVEVTSERIDVDDVTEQYVDMEARLTNLRASEQRYLEVLEQAESVEDILRVREQLDRTRGEIERLEARLTNLERQVSMSTIRVSLVSEADVEVMGVVWRPLTEIKIALNALVENLVQFVNFVIKFVFMLPIYLLWILMIVLIGTGLWKGGRLAWRKVWRRG